MKTALEVLTYLLIIAGILFSLLASANLAPGRGSLWRFFWRGPFARRELFTTVGWRFRNLALTCAMLAAVLGVLQAVRGF